MYGIGDYNKIDEIIGKNFDDDKEVRSFIENVSKDEKIIALFTSKWMLKT